MPEMPQFSDVPIKDEAIHRVACDIFEDYLKSVGYGEGEGPHVAFVRSERDEHGEYLDAVLYDNCGSYVLRIDRKTNAAILKKHPSENEMPIHHPLSSAAQGGLWGEYQSFLPIRNWEAIRLEEERFRRDLLHMDGSE